MTLRKPDHIAHGLASPHRERDNSYLVEKSRSYRGTRLTSHQPSHARTPCMCTHQNNTATGIIITRRSRANEPSQLKNCIRSVAFMCASGGVGCRWANQYRVLLREPQKSTELSFQAQKSRKKTSYSEMSAGSYGPSHSSPITSLQRLAACPTAPRVTGSPAALSLRHPSWSRSWLRSTHPLESSTNPKRKAGKEDKACPHGSRLQQGLATTNRDSTAKVCASHAYLSRGKLSDVGNVVKPERCPTAHRASRLLGSSQGISVTLTPSHEFRRQSSSTLENIGVPPIALCAAGKPFIGGA